MQTKTKIGLGQKWPHLRIMIQWCRPPGYCWRHWTWPPTSKVLNWQVLTGWNAFVRHLLKPEFLVLLIFQLHLLHTQIPRQWAGYPWHELRPIQVIHIWHTQFLVDPETARRMTVDQGVFASRPSVFGYPPWIDFMCQQLNQLCLRNLIKHEGFKPIWPGIFQGKASWARKTTCNSEVTTATVATSPSSQLLQRDTQRKTYDINSAPHPVIMATTLGAALKLIQALLVLGILKEWPASIRLV